MLRKAFNWLLLVLPAGWVVGLAFSIWVLLEGLIAFYAWQFPLPGVAEPFLRIRDGVAIASCAAFGAFRVFGLHPLCNADYRFWLSFTPWRRGLPLPAGPVHLAPQDGVIMGAILLALHDAQLPHLALPAAFLLAYLGALLFTFASVGFWAASYVLAFVLGLAVRLDLISLWGFGLLVLLVVVSQFVLSRSLDEFPWPGFSMKKPIQEDPLLAYSVGWPFSQLQPCAPQTGICFRDGILLSLLAGWWTFALCSTIHNLEVKHVLENVFQRLLPPLIAVFRLMIYLPNHRSPISLLGRLFTCRWLIPSYDRVFAAPLCILLITIFAPPAIDDLSAWLGIALSTPHLVLSLALLAGLTLGPPLKDWRLASRCRIVPGALNAKELLEV